MVVVKYENFERFSIVGRSIYIAGWARDADPHLYYAGRRVEMITTPVERHDVAVAFDDPTASKWGFECVGLLPTDRIDRSLLAFGFRLGEIVYDPARDKIPMEDCAYQAMQDRFIAMVNESQGSLLEIGSRARSGNSYRSWFPDNIEYVGLDVSAGENVDVVGDAHDMPIQRQFDHAFSISVFEHLLMPWKVALELNRCLKLGGTAFIASHGSFPLHDEPWDFWRFSKEAWGGLFNAHTGFEVLDAQYRYPASIVPRFVSDGGFETMNLAPAYLTSGCLVRKTGNRKVEWAAAVSEVYDLRYSHG